MLMSIVRLLVCLMKIWQQQGSKPHSGRLRQENSYAFQNALQMVMKGDYGKRQTSNTLANLQSWIKIQTQIRTRRLAMVEESGIKQKKRENQLRHDAKVCDLVVQEKA
ncbi:hypothetical protein Tco_0030290 [Tanacetum coccineum]